MVKEKTTPEEPTAELSSRLVDHVEVEVDVVLGEARLPISRLSALDRGDVVPLDRKLSEAAEIRVSGRVIAHGEIVTVGDRFAVRVTGIGERG